MANKKKQTFDETPTMVRMLCSLAQMDAANVQRGECVTLPKYEADAYIADGTAEPFGVVLKECVQKIHEAGGTIEVKDPKKHKELLDVITEFASEQGE